jgi:hypothetical protein
MRLRRAIVWAGVALTLGAVFTAYLAPQFAVTLASQLWACF